MLIGIKNGERCMIVTDCAKTAAWFESYVDEMVEKRDENSTVSS